MTWRDRGETSNKLVLLPVLRIELSSNYGWRKSTKATWFYMGQIALRVSEKAATASNEKALDLKVSKVQPSSNHFQRNRVILLA